MLQKRKNRRECEYGCCQCPTDKGTFRAREKRAWKKEAE